MVEFSGNKIFIQFVQYNVISCGKRGGILKNGLTEHSDHIQNSDDNDQVLYNHICNNNVLLKK